MSAIAFGTAALEALFSRSTQSSGDKFKQAFQQLGKDLQSGDVKQAENDLATLQPNATSSQTPGSQSSVVSQAFRQISQDLQSGNLSAAQSDYATLQQDLQSGHSHHHRAHAGVHGNSAEIQQILSQLGQALQSGNISAAQQAYATLQSDLPGFMSGNTSAAASSVASPVSVSA